MEITNQNPDETPLNTRRLGLSNALFRSIPLGAIQEDDYGDLSKEQMETSITI